MLLYFIFVRPTDDPIENFLLIFNESIVFICTLHLYMFSLGNENMQSINNVGWSYAALIMLKVVVNIGCKIFQLAKSLIKFIKTKIAQLR